MMFLKLPEAGPDQGSVHLQTGFHHALDLEDAVAENQKDAAKILPVSCAAGN